MADTIDPADYTVENASHYYWQRLTPERKEKYRHEDFAGGYRAAINDARPLLEKLANEAWMRQDYKLNAEICRLLGEKSALEHEQGEDAP